MGLSGSSTNCSHSKWFDYEANHPCSILYHWTSKSSRPMANWFGEEEKEKNPKIKPKKGDKGVRHGA